MKCSSTERSIPVAGGAEMVVTVFTPAAPPGAPAVLFLFPGGGYNRHYFDLDIEGLDGPGQARSHAERGIIVVTVDNLGTGDSDLPADRMRHGDAPRPGRDTSLSLSDLADAGHVVVRAVLEELAAGTLTPDLPPVPAPVVIGMGQSMGGHVVCLMQSDHSTFDAVGMLGTSFTQTLLTLLPGRRRPFRSEPASALYASLGRDVDRRASFHGDDTPAWLIDLDTDPAAPPAWRTPYAPADASRLVEPYVLSRQAASVRVPVLLVYGELDVTADPLHDLAVFRSCADLALLVVPRMGHMHNFSDGRERVWRRVESFVAQVTAQAVTSGDGCTVD